jgi:putative membrane protein
VKEFLQRWAIYSIAVLAAVFLVDGIDYREPWHALIAALVLGLLNTFVRPFLMAISVSLLIFTLGFFMLVINALLLWFTGTILSPWFVVTGFWPAFWGALIIGLVSIGINFVINGSRLRVQVMRQPPRRERDDDVIDV